MKLVVGLGNVGDKYVGTRHNFGFEVIDRLIQQNFPLASFQNFENVGFLIKENFFGESVLFFKPTLFMNNSGISTRKVKDYYKISLENVLVIVDDTSLELGNIRLRASGSSAGHNGLKSIISHLGTENFARLRLGIGLDTQIALPDYVLAKFTKQELDNVNKTLENAIEAVAVWIKFGNEKVMQKFNKKSLNT